MTETQEVYKMKAATVVMARPKLEPKQKAPPCTGFVKNIDLSK